MIKLGTAVGSNDAACRISGGQDGILRMGLRFRISGFWFELWSMLIITYCLRAASARTHVARIRLAIP